MQADFFSILLKNGPPLGGTPELLSEQGDIQQSFSHLRQIGDCSRNVHEYCGLIQTSVT
jgi:hypothetical protein